MTEFIPIRLLLAVVLAISSPGWWCCCLLAGRECTMEVVRSSVPTGPIASGCPVAADDADPGGCCGQTEKRQDETDEPDDDRPGCRCGGHLGPFGLAAVVALPAPVAGDGLMPALMAAAPSWAAEPAAGRTGPPSAAAAVGIPRAPSLYAQRTLLTI